MSIWTQHFPSYKSNSHSLVSNSDSKDCSLPESSVHRLLQARILQWVAISFSRESPDPGIKHRTPALQTDSYHLSHQGSLLLRDISKHKDISKYKSNRGNILNNPLPQALSLQNVNSVKAALNMPANLENSAVVTGLGKGQFAFPCQRKAMLKNVQTTTQLHSSYTPPN